MKNLRNIVLVDDHHVMRSGLRKLIENLGPYKVIEEFGNGLDLLDFVKKAPNVDLIVMDIEMPGMKGTEVIDELNKIGSSIPVMILSFDTDEKKQVQLFRAGVRGYLQKSATADEMKIALQDILERGYHQNAHLINALKTSNEKQVQSPREKILIQLTERELEFLSHVCNEEEFTYEQIASRMKVHRRTIDNYREAVFEKFGIKSKTGLVLLAMKNNLFE